MSCVEFSVFGHGTRYSTTRLINPHQQARTWLPDHVNIDRDDAEGWAFHLPLPRRLVLPTDTLTTLAVERGGIVPTHVTVTRQRRVRFHIVRQAGHAPQVHTLYAPDTTTPSRLLTALPGLPLFYRIYQSDDDTLTHLQKITRVTPLWKLQEAADDLILLMRPTERVILRVHPRNPQRDPRDHTVHVDPLERFENWIVSTNIPYRVFHIVYRDRLIPHDRTLRDVRQTYGPSRIVHVIPPSQRRYYQEG